MTLQTADTSATETPAPVPGTPEYDAAMVALKRGSDEASNPYSESLTPTEAPVRPDHVPEKFWNAETGQVDVDGLLKSYTELESGRGRQASEDGPPAQANAEAEAQAQETVTKAGLDWGTLVNKVVANGDIEASDYEALTAVGVPSDLVREVIELRTYRFQQEQAAAVDYAGGKEGADALMRWAGDNLNDADKAAYQEMLNGPHWRVAIDALKARQTSSSKLAAEPNLQRPAGGSAPAGVAFASRQDMMAEMRNPLYHDPGPQGVKFRAEVMRRASLSDWNRK